MKYNILGFDQQQVLKISKTIKSIDNKKDKILKLDLIDLQILQVISDFMNRSKIIKYTIDDKTYFSVQYKVILDDLPILDIKQQALSDRLSKMAELDILEKKVVRNQSGSYSVFRMGSKYEQLIYNDMSSELHLQMYSTTSAEVVNYTPKDYSTNNYSTNTINKEEEDKKQDWKKDFNAYYQLVLQAQHQLLYDDNYKAQKEKFHPNIDYELSLEKMVTEYWGTERAWEHKKKSKSKEINMVTTLKKAFDISSNRVYKKIQFGKTTPKEIKEQIPQNANYTRVPLHPKLKFIDDEGKLNDGTFVKDGYRYYFSNRDITTYSIPPATEPKPEGDNYEYDGNYGWYLSE